MYVATGDAELADQSYERAGDVFRSLASERPHDPVPLGELAICETVYGCHLLERDDRSAAERRFESSRAAVIAWLRVVPEQWDDSHSVPLFAMARSLSGDELRPLIERARRYAEQSRNPSFALACYAHMTYRLRDWQGAATAARESIALREKAARPTSYPKIILALALWRLGNAAEASTLYASATEEDAQIRQQREDNSPLHGEAVSLFAVPAPDAAPQNTGR